MTEKYTPRHVNIKEENIEKMKEIKDAAGRSQQWIVNYALEYLFEHEWDRLIK